MKRRQAGFSLVSAVFIIVVLALVVAYMAQVSTVQLATIGQGTQGTRAYYAAQSAIQWAVADILATDSCSSGSFSVNGFDISVSCNSVAVQDPPSRSITLYEVTALAERNVGSADYVSREIRVSFSDPAL